eukprot:scaffold7684_cov119-Isochrysis_galbana.AAC.2
MNYERARPRLRMTEREELWGVGECPQAPLDVAVAELETPERRGFRYGVHSAVQACLFCRLKKVQSAGRGLRCACGGNACAYRLAGCWDVAWPLGEGAKLLFAIVDLMSVNGTLPFGHVHVRVACETLTLTPHRHRSFPTSQI